MFMRIYLDKKIGLRMAIVIFMSSAIASHASSWVAEFDGVRVYLEQVKPHKMEIEAQPSRDVLEMETLRLRRLVEAHVVEQAIISKNIHVSEAEAEAAASEMLKAGDVNSDTIDYLNRWRDAVIGALNDYLGHPERDNAIYEELITQVDVSKMEWDMLKENHQTAAAIDELSNGIPANMDELKRQSSESMRRDILRQRLRRHIAREFAVDESRIQSHLRAIGRSHYADRRLDEDQLITLATQIEKDKMYRAWLAETVDTMEIIFQSPSHMHAWIRQFGEEGNIKLLPAEADDKE